MSKPESYSSQSYSPACRSGALKSQATGSNLDPKDQSAKTKEKEQMVGLNDKLVAFIDKVKHLENENKKLETQLRILKEQENYEGKIDQVVQETEADLLRQVESLTRDRHKLGAELEECQKEVEDSKKQYEVEFQKKTDLENEFIITKKDVENGHLAKVELALDLEVSTGELDFLRLGYEEEIKELESQVQNETVVVPEDMKRSLDMDEIITGINAQYRNTAARNRAEAERWNQKKMDDMVRSAGQHQEDVRSVKKDLGEMKRTIQTLRVELEALRKKKDSVERELEAVEGEGQKSLAVTRDNIGQLEGARHRAKQDLTLQLREYQELMNLKLELDIEIATYRKLLEGEESRMDDRMRQ